jgi:CHAD domain-containing protein
MGSELLLPEGVTRETAFASVRERLSLRDGVLGHTDRTFYDTFDGLLHRAGLLVVYTGPPAGRLALVDLEDEQEVVSLKLAAAPDRVLPIELDAAPMRDELVAVVGVRALLARVRVRTRLHGVDVLDDRGKIVVRMAVLEPAVVTSEQRSIALRPRLRLAGVRGYDTELQRVRRTLERDLGFAAAPGPLVDEAVAATGADPAGTSSKLRIKLARKQRADAAAVVVLRALLSVIEANLEGVIADVDAEFLHDFRVAIRRTRAVQRELRRVFPPVELARFREQFRELQRVTGDARDLDVYVLGFDSMRELVPAQARPDLEPLLGVLRARRLTARREMVRALRSDQTRTLRAQWVSFLDRLVAMPVQDRPDAAAPIAGVAGARIVKVYTRMVKMGRAIDDRSPPEALHELRKQGKELRYLLELFAAAVYPSEVVKPMVKSLKSLQDVLGRHQDRAVQVGMLRGLSDEVSALPGGGAALMAMGLLVERLAADQQAARDELAEPFAAFASKPKRRLVKETFSAG